MDLTNSFQLVAELIAQCFPLAVAFGIGQKVVRIFINCVFGKGFDI